MNQKEPLKHRQRASVRGPGPRPPLDLLAAQKIVASVSADTAVLVEGWSDQAAVETLASRVGYELGAMRIVVLPIGGATNLRRFAACLGEQGLALALCGLYDRAEERHFLGGLQPGGPAKALTRADAERLGFFVCDEDLEDELIRALGPPAVEHVIGVEGEADALRRFQVQPAQRGRDLHSQLRRFMGTRAGRKIRYGALLAAALDLDRLPKPLAALLIHLRRPSVPGL
ncbi:MAG: TOPRIM nucleotidyl transferase/hydrolase domain-containing protein [Burkholderiaceae bacterium]